MSADQTYMWKGVCVVPRSSFSLGREFFQVEDHEKVVAHLFHNPDWSDGDDEWARPKYWVDLKIQAVVKDALSELYR